MALPTDLSYDDRGNLRAKRLSGQRVPAGHGGAEVGQFGDKFRKERERKGISLEDVSNVTKISSRMLQAIEQEQFDLLPGGVFNRGFIRAYAKHLGLNDEEAVTDYLACLRQAQIDAQANWQPPDRSIERPAPAPRGPYVKPALKKQPPATEVEELPELHLPRAEDVRPPRRDYIDKRGGVPWTILAAAAVVVVLVAALWFRQSGKHAQSGAQAASAPAATSPAPAARSTPSSATQIATATTQPSAPRSNSNVTSTPRLLASSSPEKPGAKASEATHRASPAPSNSSSSSDTSGSNPAANEAATRAIPPQNAGTPPPSSAPSAQAGSSNAASSNVPAAEARPLTLVIRASETSWISIIADGQPVSHETLIAPAHASIRASREIIARIGNAAGVTFLWNGQEIPAQGAEAEVKTFVFDAQGMHEVPNQPPVPNQPVPNQ